MQTPVQKQKNVTRALQQGLSLIELMISITIGLLILVSLTTLFVNQSRMRAELDKSNRMIDNGRYATEVLAENLKLAGYYGELNPSGLAIPTSITDPCTTNAATMAAMLPLHVVGYDAAGPTSSIASPPCSFASTDLKAGSDILVLRRADTSGSILQAWAAANSTVAHYIQVSLCQYDDVATPFRISTAPASLTLRGRDCSQGSTTPYANLRRFLVQTYFISPNNNAGDGIPTLKRKEIDSAGGITTTPLVEGIEYMQVEYGFDDPAADTNGDGVFAADGIPDSYKTCSACTATDFANVVSVKINLIARNIEKSNGYVDTKTYQLGQAGTFGPFNDQYKRHAYTQVIRLVNPSSRKEVP